MEDFVDSYEISWKLRDDEGNEWWEGFDNMSLTDFEILYGNNVHQIIRVEMRLKRGTNSCDDN